MERVIIIGADTMDKVLGIIGGMGPLSAVKLFERIVLLTDANCDQEHLRIFIDNNTSIPDRTDYILGKITDDPRAQLIESAQKLQSIGADYLVICCNTAHYFYEDLVQSVDIPILNMIEEAAKYIVEEYKDIKNIGLLSTEGTAKVLVYDNMFEKYGINIIKPSNENQQHITNMIYNIKKGIPNEDLTGFYKAMEEIKSKDANIFVTGCTELSLAIDLYKLEGDFINPLELLAIKAIEYSGKSVI